MISESLLNATGRHPLPGDTGAAERFAERLRGIAGKPDQNANAAFWQATLDDPASRRFLDGVGGNSPFLASIVVGDPDFAAGLLRDGPDQALDALNAEIAALAPAKLSTDELCARLRQLKKRIALLCGSADMANTWPVHKTTGVLSDFASQSLQAATAHLMTKGANAGEIELPHADDPEKDCGFICLGMGKLGARELNYSSDIDLILLYDPDKVAYVGSRSIQEFFNRFARDLVKILEERTRDGYVFRMDLRLRPDPGSTPPVISTLAAEAYYESAGQNWERAAMIKARAVAGDIEAGEAFLHILTPFIWRRSLDFAAIQDIHSIKRQINAVRGGDKIAVGGHNVKLGRGGIREIEFFAQTQQLIWGGRDASLRPCGTCDALKALTTAEHISAETCADLIEAYDFLRTIEHRLQMVDDQQTHEIPDGDDKLAHIAAFCGYPSVDAFEDAVSATLHVVEDHYAGLFEDEPELGGPGALVFTGGEDHPDTLRTLADMGFREPASASAVVRNWHHGRFRAVRSARARELLTEMVPGLLQAFSKSPDPDAALMRFNDFLSGLPAGVQLFSLLHSHPGLFDLVSEIMGGAPLLAETLKRHPILFDAVLTADFFDSPPEEDELKDELRTMLREANDFQDVLDITRRQVNDRIFQIGVQMLRGRIAPADAGGHLSDIADSVLQILYDSLVAEYAERHGVFPGGDMAIVALGKHGGSEITIGSDLDLLFVYDSGAAETSDGDKPLTPTPYYTRLGQRFLSAVSSPTGQGMLYEVDLRLRPSGNSGPLATTLSSFREYHESAAWTWEHMALSRARIIRAAPALEEALNQAIRDVLTKPRDPDKLLKDVADMRARMERDRKSEGACDIKNMRGGLVDVEFIAQYLQLRHAAEAPEILSPNTGEALSRLATAGFLSESHANALREALILWRNLQAILRLTVGEGFDESTASEASKAALVRCSGAADFPEMQQLVKESADACLAIFRDIIEKPAAALAGSDSDGT